MIREFELRPSVEDGNVVLAVAGELDIGTAPRLREQVVTMINGGCTRLVLDLAELTFLDSPGLSVLIMALKRLREQDGELVLRSTPTQAQAVLDMSGLGSVFATA